MVANAVVPGWWGCGAEHMLREDVKQVKGWNLSRTQTCLQQLFRNSNDSLIVEKRVWFTAKSHKLSPSPLR